MRMKPAEVLLWAALVLAPLAVYAIAMTALPEGTTVIPLHWGLNGTVDRYGNPHELFTLAGIMAAVNAGMALLYRFNDKLYEAGFVHGVSREGARKVYVVCALVMVAITVPIYAFVIAAATA